MTRRTGKNPWLYPPKDSKQARITKTGRELVPTGPTVSLRLGIDKNNITKAKENIAKELNIPEDSIPFTLLIHYTTTKYLNEAIKQLTDLDQNKHTNPNTSQRTKAADYEKITKASEETNIDKTSIIKAMIALTARQTNPTTQGTNQMNKTPKPDEYWFKNTTQKSPRVLVLKPTHTGRQTVESDEGWIHHNWDFIGWHHEPHCTGFNWQPPKTDPYEYLPIGTTLQENDEYETTLGWYKTKSVGYIIGSHNVPFRKYRRRKTEPNNDK